VNFKPQQQHLLTSPIIQQSLLESAKMSNPQDAWKKLQRMANQAGKGGPNPKGLAGGVGGLLLLGGAIMVGNNALFNVDGGHRAIKYTRIGGVSKEIYSEGKDDTLGCLQASDGN
jgi:hypothetical protein